MSTNTKPTTEERIWAVVSHLSALAFGMGIMLPILGWSEQRRKSKYAAFQSLQALGYQSLGYTIWFLSYIVLVILMLVAMVVATANSSQDSTTFAVFMGMVFLIVFGFFGLYMFLPVIAAIACGFGRDFRYPVMGRRLAGYLDYNFSEEAEESAPLNDEHQERWVASMGHFSVIVMFWGLFAPLTTWILQRRQRNTFLKFQSIQTTIYQAVVNLLYLGALALSFVATVPMLLLTVLPESSSTSSPAIMLGMILFLFSMLVATVFLLVIPLFHILGQWAGYRVLKGDNYRYPLIGKMVERKLEKSYGVESSGEPLDSMKESA